MFFGLVALGLPISVAIGWTLATPQRPASIGAPAGTGGLGDGGGNGVIGTAPHRGTASQPVTEVQYSPRPVPSAATLAVTAPSSAPIPTTAPPSTAASADPSPPILDQPPVPTPTEITVIPSDSADPSADPSGRPESGTRTPEP